MNKRFHESRLFLNEWHVNPPSATDWTTAQPMRRESWNPARPLEMP
jgi:hypothetical protein